MLIPGIQLRLDRMGAPGWSIGAVLGSMFMVQLLVSPLWGRLSDRTGRKPVIIVCTLISASSMLLYAFADSPGLVLLSRILAGLGAANIAVTQAYISDLNATGTKLARMGRIGAAISAGLIAGPALGGFLSRFGDFHLIGLTATAFSTLGAIAVAIILPKLTPTKSQQKPKGNFDLIRSIPGLARVFAVIAIGWFALATLEGTFGRLIKATLGLGEFEFGLIFAYESLLAVLVQSLFVERIEKRFNTTPSLKVSYCLMGIGLALFPFAPGLWALFVASTLYAVGSAVANPMANALCSQLTPEEKQGELFGLIQSARSFGFIVGPILGGKFFDLNHAAPYILSMLVCLVAAIVVPKYPGIRSSHG